MLFIRRVTLSTFVHFFRKAKIESLMSECNWVKRFILVSTRPYNNFFFGTKLRAISPISELEFDVAYSVLEITNVIMLTVKVLLQKIDLFSPLAKNFWLSFL